MRKMIIDPATGRFIRLHKIVDKTCPCGKNFQTTQDRIDDGRGKTCSKTCMYKYRPTKSGQEHGMWKDDAKYSAIHKWVAYHFGQPMRCEQCDFTTDNKYQIQWANLSGEYKRERDDWARLCAKCHWHLDRVERYATS